MNEKITITIPTFNRSKYLEEAIESVIKQTYTNFRLVILDNASTDDTESIVRRFDDSRLFYTKSAFKLDFAQSLNRSFYYCESEYLMIFHDDDILHPDFLKSNLQILERDDTITLLSSSTYSIDEKGNERTEYQILDKDIVFEQFEYWKSYYLDNIYLTMPTVLYRSKFVKENNLRFRNNVGPNLDQYLWFEINCFKCKLLLRKEKLYYYRRHSGQQANWVLQAILLDRKAYWFALENKITEVVEKIDSNKKNQLKYLIKFCIKNNSFLIGELYKEGYWNTILGNLNYKITVKLFSLNSIVTSLNYVKNIITKK